MKKVFLRALPLLLLFALALAGCARSAAAPAAASANPWPTHAPGATPYVHTMSETAPAPETQEGEVFETMEDLWDSIYERFGNFYAKKDELKMFRELPQNEPYSFVPHSPRDVLDEGEAMRTAKLFDAQDGVEARVIAMHSIVDGLDDWGFLTVLTMTPARLFELSEELDENFMFEQFYSSVEKRFDIAYWPDGLCKETEELLQGLEVRGCLYFEPGTLEALNDVDPSEVLDFALKELTPSGWSEDGQQLIWILRGRELEGFALYWRKGTSAGGSLCVASMSMRQLSVLSDTLPGRYLVRLADENVLNGYDGVIRLTPDGQEVTEP